MSVVVPVGVVIPTYNRGLAVLSTLQHIRKCDPQPAEILVHIDRADGALENHLRGEFADVTILTSKTRLGPGGGRHRCLSLCRQPYAVSFDDDSYPVDPDFFRRVVELFAADPCAAVFGANIWHRNQTPIPAGDRLIRTSSYTGCGYAIRLEAYRQIRGHLPRPVPYGMEEIDVSLQLFAAGWHIYDSAKLRVFHNTELSHHSSPEIVAGCVANVALYAFLNYPIRGWCRGLLQIVNTIVFSIRMGRLVGLISGVLAIPFDCYRNRQYRNPIPWRTVKQFLKFRRTGCAP